MLDWSVYRKGSLAAWIRHSLESLLAPYRLGKSRKVRASAKRAIR